MASHIGKLPVTIPAGVEVKIDGQSFTAKGAKGTDSYEIPEGITTQDEGTEDAAQHEKARGLRDR